METKKLKPNEPDKVVSDPSPELPWADKDNAIPPAKLGSESGLGSSPDATAKPKLGTDPTTILHSRPEEVGESAEGRTQFEAVVTGQEAAPPELSDMIKSGSDPATDSTEHLNAAIGELEDALSERADADSLLSTRQSAKGFQPAQGEQYTIPMLDNALAPSGELDNLEPVVNHAAELEAFQENAGGYRPIFERLASEIEIIVQTGVDDALQEAGKRILQRVNDHIEIVLPEILDELSRKSRDDQ